MIKLKHPKLDILFTGLIFVALAGGLLYIYRTTGVKNLPAGITLAVPFSAQAPTNNWTRNEDCEEASITMANAFLTAFTEDKLPTGSAQTAINTLKKWEEANLGYNKDTGADATTKMAEGAFGLKIRQIKNFTAEDLKTELINGHPILLPINARLLGSPQYLNDGPTYHMVVIRGYKDSIFIVNDPGTNNGDGNEYFFEILKKASADWNNVTKQMEPERKIALVVYKKK